MNLEELLKILIAEGGSDLHLKVGRRPLVRINGDLKESAAFPIVESDALEAMIESVTTLEQRKKLKEEHELDFSFQVQSLARFRGNVFFQRGQLASVFRLIPTDIPTIEGLKLPEILKEIVKKHQGLILVTGPTGSGKTTTLASMIQYINATQAKHIITIEDPIEFSFVDQMGSINQREVGQDTANFAQALRRALRQDPDVILVGELRDAESISTALRAAETGHLVFGTLHTNDARQSIGRIIDVFEGEEQGQVRLELAACLVAVISQRLIKRTDGVGRVAAVELLLNTPTVRKLIEENKTGQITKVMEESASFYQMQTFNQALIKLIKEGMISVDNALSISENANDLKIQIQTQGISMKLPGQPSGTLPPISPQ